MSDTPNERCVIKSVTDDGTTTICTLTLNTPRLTTGSLLIDGTQELVDFFTAAQAGADGAVVIDLCVADAGPKLQPAVEGFLQAAKAVLHSWVLENGSAVRPANAVVSLPQQGVARRQTVEYFTSPRGQFSRGSFIDLRSTNR